MIEAYKYQKFNLQKYTANTQFVPNMTEFKLRTYMSEKLPLKMLEYVAKLPFATTKIKEQSALFNKYSQLLSSMIKQFDFFIKGDWHYENKKIYKLINMMSPEERGEFQCDVRDIDWLHFLGLYAKGLAIWVLSED